MILSSAQHEFKIPSMKFNAPDKLMPVDFFSIRNRSRSSITTTDFGVVSSRRSFRSESPVTKLDFPVPDGLYKRKLRFHTRPNLWVDRCANGMDLHRTFPSPPMDCVPASASNHVSLAAPFALKLRFRSLKTQEFLTLLILFIASIKRKHFDISEIGVTFKHLCGTRLFNMPEMNHSESKS
ncbi:hypothetical protein K1719_003548 [Acacia pycnantha]|nr:hypothetical protein K1719_003548 [Acacia pycnantha]